MLTRFVMALVIVAVLVQGCNTVTTGPDLVRCDCDCLAGGSGVVIPVEGFVCVDSSNPAAVKDACQDECKCKSAELPFGGCACIHCPEGSVTLQACRFVPPSGPDTSFQGKCPEGRMTRAAGGDFGLTRASTTDGSTVVVSGADIEPLSLTPALTVQTTQVGSSLMVAQIEGALADTTFTSAGFFGTSGHSFRGGRMFLTIAFGVDLQPD